MATYKLLQSLETSIDRVSGRYEVQGAIALFERIWDMLFPSERSRILHLLLESAVHDGIKG